MFYGCFLVYLYYFCPTGGYTAEHPTIEIFWRVLHNFTEEEKRKFLLFVTSCSRPPLLGFKEIDLPFCIHNGGTPDRLPTSSTCLNLVRIPQYIDDITMRDKLIYCVESQAGFELS
uniref:HECT-type E3 ubiquitin transferase n=1 Tax=Ciona savignyi TaxID=51511 RepID=H2Y6U0_CIOSA